MTWQQLIDLEEWIRELWPHSAPRTEHELETWHRMFEPYEFADIYQAVNTWHSQGNPHPPGTTAVLMPLIREAAHRRIQQTPQLEPPEPDGPTLAEYLTQEGYKSIRDALERISQQEATR